MSLWILVPIGLAMVIVWHEWRQRKLPWPGERAPMIGDKGWRCTACGRSYQGCIAIGTCGDAPMEPIR